MTTNEDEIMLGDLILTESERAMVLQRREQEAKEAKNRAFRLKALGIAADYEAWLQTNNRGSTFSTFVEEFGYDELGADYVFRHVEAIRAAVGCPS